MRFNKYLTAYLLSAAAMTAAGISADAQQLARKSGAVAPQLNDDTIWLVGEVKDLDAQVPIMNARVEIDGQPVELRTNKDGKFFVRGKRGHNHTISIRAMGYEPYTFNLTSEENEPAEVWMMRTNGQKRHRRASGDLLNGKHPHRDNRIK